MSCVNENQGLLRRCGGNWAPNMPSMFWPSHSTLTVPPLAYAPPPPWISQKGTDTQESRPLVQERSSADPRPLATHLLASTKLFPRPPPLASWKKSYDQPRQVIKKQKHYFATKGPSSQCEAARVNTMTGGLDLSFGFPRNGKIPHPHQVT